MVFILHQELSLYEFYQQQIGAIDAEIEQCLAKFPSVTEEPPPPSVKKNCRRKTHPPSYQELGADYYEQQYRQRVINNLSKKAQSLGFQLVEASST
jgi:hypothetical protein